MALITGKMRAETGKKSLDKMKTSFIGKGTVTYTCTLVHLPPANLARRTECFGE